jgi:hypothetical protein
VDFSPRSIGAHILALGFVVGAGEMTAWDIAGVAIAVVVAAFLVGGIAGGRLIVRALVYGGLVSLAVLGATAALVVPFWAMPLAAFGVWAGADFRRSLVEIAASRR